MIKWNCDKDCSDFMDAALGGTKRIKRFSITGMLLVEMLSDGVHRYCIKSGLPEDCRVINCRLSEHGIIELILESREYEPIKMGDVIPVVSPPIACVERKTKGTSQGGQG